MNTFIDFEPANVPASAPLSGWPAHSRAPTILNCPASIASAMIRLPFGLPRRL